MPSAPPSAPPAPAAAPAPAAPPSKPAAPAAAAPAAPSAEPSSLPTGTPPDPNEAGSAFNAPFASLDKMFKDEPTEPKKPDVKPASGEPAKPAAPAAPPKEEFKSAPELRNAYNRSKEENQTLKAEIERLKTTKPADDPEKKTLVDKLTDYEKKIKEYDDEIKYHDYTKSEEFKKQYQEPYNEAVRSALNDFEYMQIEQEDGTARKPTVDDLRTLLQLPPAEAVKQAKAWFGDAYTEVMAHRRKIAELITKQNTAKEEYRTKGEERSKETTAKSAQQRQQMETHWAELTQKPAKAMPELFAPDEADPEGNKLLESGTSMFNSFFDGKNGISVSDRMNIGAAMLAKASAFDRQVYRTKQLQAKVEALQKELDGFKASEPGGGEATNGPDTESKSPWDKVDSMIDKMPAR